MALGTIGDPDGLSQGASTAVADLTFSGLATRDITINGTTTLPLLLDNEWIEIRGATNTENNGLYIVNDAAPDTSNTTLTKVSGAPPSNDAVANTGASIFSHNHYCH